MGRKDVRLAGQSGRRVTPSGHVKEATRTRRWRYPGRAHTFSWLVQPQSVAPCRAITIPFGRVYSPRRDQSPTALINEHRIATHVFPPRKRTSADRPPRRNLPQRSAVPQNPPVARQNRDFRSDRIGSGDTFRSCRCRLRLKGIGWKGCAMRDQTRRTEYTRIELAVLYLAEAKPTHTLPLTPGSAARG